MKLYRYIIGFCIWFLFSACAGMSFFSDSEKVLTTYMPSGNLQYYLRPAKMLSAEFKSDDAFITADFTYQKSNRTYVGNAYVNFTLTYKTKAFISKAYFKTDDNVIIPLSHISLLSRNIQKNHIRVSTVLESGRIHEVLEKLESFKAVLHIELDDGSVKTFLPTKEVAARIAEAFSK
ncbi:hypothetical protein H0R92_03590 [Treponema sp. OMZ 840]|uniref:hypothetical protein n=1 Tax=Treponema sp. OMZ 840 TaxID=244313 RepID=UPI003D90A1DA